MKIEIITSILNNKFKRNRNLVLKAIKQFEGKDVMISFSKPKKTRSILQNNYYWGVVINIVQQGLVDATGEFRSDKDIHYNILLPMFSPINEIVNIDTGEFISERITSSEMTTTQFCEYIIEIQKWGAEFLNIDIPSPKEEMMLNFEQ